MDDNKKIEILEKLRDEIEIACKCGFLSFSEKQEWCEQVEALNWALVRLNYYERRNK